MIGGALVGASTVETVDRGGAHGPAVCDFIGRGAELQELSAALGEALDGRGQVVLLAGDAGIGKTRTAEECARAARSRGARVLVGRGEDSEGAPAYWPWVQVVRGWVEGREDTWCDEMGPCAVEVSRLLSEARRRSADPLDIGCSADLTGRFQFFDGIATCLRRIARDAPLLVLLDDLQGADRASLLLLRFVARQIRDHGILLVGTYRDAEVSPEHPLTETVADLGREPHYRHVTLTGLARDDVARLIEYVAGQPAAPAVVDHIQATTEGNPLFVTELVRLLSASGSVADVGTTRHRPLAVPDGVRAVVGRRLGRLSAPCREVLTIAALIGQRFGVGLLERVTGVACDRLLDVLGEALRARVVVEPSGALGRYAFAHGLIRETLYASLDPSRRVAIHRRIAEALEASGDPEVSLSELAYHFFQAAPGGDGARAIEYAVRAAERAMAGLAYEEAIANYERAIQVLDLTPSAEDRRCDVLLGLGTAATRAGEWRRGRAAFQRAGDIARQLGAADRLARAAVGAATWIDGITANPTVAPLLEEALGALPAEDGRLRALLLGHLARVLYFGDTTGRAREHAREAVAMARRLGDPGTLGTVLSLQRYALWGPGNIEERLAASDEIVSLAERPGNRELAFAGHAYRVADLLEMGDMRAAEVEVERCARLAAELGRPPFLAWFPVVWRATLALFQGRFDDARRLVESGFPLAGQTGDENAVVCLSYQLLALRRESGLDGMSGSVAAALERHPEMHSLRAQLAWVHAEVGELDEAARHFERLAATDFAILPRDFNWLAAMVVLADVAAALRDAPRAGVLYELLRPFARYNATLALGVYCHGTVAHALGRLAATMSRWDDAGRHFDDALARNAAMGTPPNLARTEHACAAMLLARGAPGDRVRAAALLAQAYETAQRLGMTTLVARVDALRAEVADVWPQPDAPGAACANGVGARSAGLLRREGEYWLVAYRGTTTRLRDSLGLRYLAHLLANPGREFLALDLVALVRRAADGTTGDEPAPRGDAGEHLDPTARDAYTARLRHLRRELAEAEAREEPERARRIEAEASFLTKELSRALGLGGRARRALSNAERARVSVTQRLRSAVARIARDHPSLGSHLSAGVRTGAFCVYLPDASGITWNF